MSTLRAGFLLSALCSLLPQAARPAESPRNTILAVGAHAGDVELTSGAVLLAQHQRGDRVVILHLTLGEGGNPGLSPAEYGAQKRREATAVGTALGAEVLFAPYRDGELPDSDEARRYVADVIRQVRPATVITHWRTSMHKDHVAANRIVADAILLAALPGVQLAHPAWRGVRRVWYAENWEDEEGFDPYVTVDVTGAFDAWKAAVSQYEFARGATSGFAYIDYYSGLAAVRGARAGKRQAVAFDVDSWSKRVVLDAVP